MKFTIALVAAVSVAEATRYKSGAVTGFEKFTYGKFITRMKAPNQKGTVSSFFTYWNGPNFYPGGWNELDVEIVPSVSQNPFSMNIIYGDGHEKRENHDYERSFDPRDDWHIYEMAWTPNYIAWSVDNKEVRRVTGEETLKYMNKGQSVMMNFWTPTFESWGKGFNAVDMPWYVLYDYVETFTWNSYTDGFDFHWRDDFNTFDANRWHKSDNTTFDANSTTFRASQSYVERGNLVLKMEPDTPQELHHGQHYIPTEVEPVETEPAYEHAVAKGKKVRKQDEHYDVLQAQHRDHYHHEEAPVHADPYGGYYGHLPREDPYGYGMYADPYAAAAHHRRAYYEGEGHHFPGQGGENPGAHLDHAVSYHHAPQEHYPGAEHTHHATVETVAPHHSVMGPHHDQGPHDATPIHAASQEPHVSSTPTYYDEMFGGHLNGEPAQDRIPLHHEFDYGYDSAGRRHLETERHHMAAEAHHPEVQVVGVRDNLSIHGAPEISHLDQTPYEHAHSDFDARFIEHDRVPHSEVVHNVHGIQDVIERIAPVEHVHAMPAIPSYEELLWAYQHGGVHHDRSYHHEQEVVHHEDIADERRRLGEYYSHEVPLYNPHQAQQEYILDHGAEHPAPYHYEQEHESHQDFHGLEEQQFYHDSRVIEEPHDHMGGPYWRGDHYGDHHKTDEDLRHDSDAHAYHPGDTYGHDTDYHQGKQVLHDIAHEYDELFHEIEAETQHGVEHHDIEYKTLPLHRREHEIDHPYTTSDFHRSAYTPHAAPVETHHEVAVEPHHEAAVTEVRETVHDQHPFQGHAAEHGHHERAHYYESHYESPHADRHYAAEGPEMYAWSVHEPHHVGVTEHYARGHHEERFLDERYHDPAIHGSHGHDEYHELDHEPFHGDVAHGDLHFEPLTKTTEHQAPVHHTIAYPEHEAPHHRAQDYHHEASQHEAVRAHEQAPHHAPAPHHGAPKAKETTEKTVAPKPSTPQQPKDAKKAPQPTTAQQKSAPAPAQKPKAPQQPSAQPAVAKKLQI